MQNKPHFIHSDSFNCDISYWLHHHFDQLGTWDNFNTMRSIKVLSVLKARSTRTAWAQLLLRTLWLCLVKKTSKLGHTLLFSLHRNKPFLTSIFTLLSVEDIKENVLYRCKKNQLIKKDFSRGMWSKGEIHCWTSICLQKLYLCFLLGFLGLKWQWLRDSFSKLMLLPFRHALPGGVKLEIQGGFWGWGAQRRCGEDISAAPEVAGSDFKRGSRRRLESLINPGWLPALGAQEWMWPWTQLC